MKRILSHLSIAVFASLVLAGPVLANSVFYSWTMNLRVVDNHVLHTMTAGTLTHQGQVWTTSTDVGFFPSVLIVHLDVYKETGFIDTYICGATVQPKKAFNVGTQFTKNCGAISSGDCFIVVWKSDDDHWNEQGQGDLITP